MRTVAVRITADVAGAVANVKTLKGTVSDLGSELDRAAVRHKDRLNTISNATGVLGVGLLGAFGYAAKAAADFDKEMSAVASVSDASGRSLDNLRQAALQAGKDTQFSATQAARAEEELAKAGVSTQQILGGALTGSLNLAAAGQMDLGDAATIAAQAMNVFKLSGAAVPHIADVLASSANTSAADMHGLGDSLKQGGQVAAQFGLTLQDTVGTLSAFADNALVGSDAGTSLKSMLLALANPSQQSAATMKQLGINAYDASGKFVGITALAGQLSDKLGGLSEQQRNAALAQIFGSDAMRAASVLYKQGADGLAKYIQGVDKYGAAAETARQKTDNLSGDVERLRGSFETLAIQSGSGANTGLRALTKTADELVSGLSSLPPFLQTASVYLVGIGGAALLAGAGLIKVRATGVQVLDGLTKMGPAGATAAEGLGKVGSVAGKLALGLVAVAVAWEGAKLIGHLTGVDEVTKVTTNDVDQLTNAMAEFARTGKTTGELRKIFGENLSDLRRQIAAVDEAKRKLDELNRLGAIGGAASSVTGGGAAARKQALLKTQADIDRNVGDADKALAALVNAGNAAAANSALQQMAQTAGMSVDELTAKMPEYKKAIDGASLANSALGQGFGSISEKASVMSRGLQDAIDHGMKLTDVFKLLNGSAIDWAHAEDNMQGAIATASQSIKDNAAQFKNGADQLDVHTEAGRRNREALLGIVETTQAAIQSKFNETQSLDEANKVYEQGRQALIANAMAAGRTRKEAEALADQWLRMPPVASTSVQAPGLNGALQSARGLMSELNSLNGRMVSFNVRGDLEYAHGAPPPRAAGGPVVGGLRYRVGERGPEDFVPAVSGTIVPNHRLRQYTVAGSSGPRLSDYTVVGGMGGGGGYAGGGAQAVTLNITVPVNAGIIADEHRLPGIISEQLVKAMSRGSAAKYYIRQMINNPGM